MEIEYEETDDEQLQELPQEVNVTKGISLFFITIAYIYRVTGCALLEFMLVMNLAID